MPSLLPGYNYDIFISYRQNDNRSGWVTEFVSALQEELATTLKNPVSVYFDTNPHDGLLETHNVDKSLEQKLKCLIFIPIISQTYCDPKSFAWQHEFCAFNWLAKADALGRDVLLSNGNVTSRILPVKIHDIDAADKAMIEQETEGVLRAVEFIYREPGVNRPLKPSDNKNDNQNKTDYRNQVNKVANAVKEISSSLIFPTQKKQKASEVSHQSERQSARQPWAKRIVAIVALLILAAFMLYINVSKEDGGIAKKRPRIVILPVRLISESGGSYFAEGIKQVLVQHLQTNEKLDVPPSLVATDRFRETTKTHREIVEELDADFIVESSVRKWGDSIHLAVTLIDPIKDAILWKQDIKTVYARFFETQETIAAGISQSLGLALSAPAKKKIQRIPTRSTEAYDYFLRAKQVARLYFAGGASNDSLRNKFASLLRHSIQADSNFAEPYGALAGLYFQPNQSNDSLEWLLEKALLIYPTFPQALNLKSQHLFFHKKDTAGSMELAIRTIQEDPYNVELIIWLAWTYHYWFKDDREILALPYYIQAYNVDPQAENIGWVTANIGIFLYQIGDYSRGEAFLNKAIELEPNDFLPMDHLIRLYFQSGQFEKLLAIAKRMETTFPKQSDGLVNKAVAFLYLGNIPAGLSACEQYLKSGEASDISAVYGQLLERSGKRGQAVQLWQSVLKSLLDENSTNHFRMARLLCKLGRQEEAIDQIQMLQFTHTREEANPDYLMADRMLESLRTEPKFIHKVKTEQDRLAGIRQRLAEMEQEKIIVLPRLLPNPK